MNKNADLALEHRRAPGPMLGLAVLCALAVSGCGTRAAPGPSKIAPPLATAPEGPPEKLSAYALFVGGPVAQRPAEGVVPYDINSPLFSDYTEKFRFIKLPAGTHADYRETEAIEFPIGTIIAKTFAYPHDARDPSQGRRLIETRILKREADGWIGLPYIWNDAQTEAVLDVAGDMVDVEWIHADGKKRTNNYIVPNSNQCKGCHWIGERMQPIGPKARQLNRDFAYYNGAENQLARWEHIGMLKGAPAPKDVPRLAVWDDPRTGPLNERARAWLEANCAHCHNPEGPARNAGLNLLASERNPTAFGVFKVPVSAGIGSGGRSFDVVPGRPDESILAYRIASTHPGVMMPELGKRLVHEEGVALVREWIAAMPVSH